jgi:hypothetical protein
MTCLNIVELCGASHTTREDGAVLRAAIQKHWSDAEPLVLDFDGVRIASVSFFDESLGLLARKYPLDELKRRIRTENMDPSDRRLLNDIVVSRSRERRLSDASSAPSAGDPSSTP